MRVPNEDYRRQSGFLHAYAEEADRMTSPAPAAPKPAAEPAAQDAAVLLPILLLLLTERADKWLLLALAYILL